MADPERIEILSERELGLTLSRLASQVLESAEDSRRLMLLGIPTRGVQLSRVLARELERLTGHAISQGPLIPRSIAMILSASAPVCPSSRLSPPALRTAR